MPIFPETRWTLLAQASLHGDAAGKAALEELCRDYWPAVLLHLVSQGYSQTVAEDLTQDLFVALMPGQVWRRADPTRGKFRSFLLGVLSRVIASRVRWENAAKRGGKSRVLELEALLDEGWEPVSTAESEFSEFDRAWAGQLLEKAMEALEGEYAGDDQFELLQQYLPLGDVDAVADYQSAADQLGISLAAFKSRLFRCRQRYRELLEAEVARTVSSPQELVEEMHWLERILADPACELL